MDYYGIDLGTSKCILARVTRDIRGDFEVKCVMDNDGNEQIPSIVHFYDGRTIIVGEKAQKYLYEKPESTIDLIKIRLGKTKIVQIEIEGKIQERSPQEISAYFLDHLKRMSKHDLSNPVITVPAFFDQDQKNATLQAGLIAEINTRSLIEEPTAAIMYHIFTSYKKNGKTFLEQKSGKTILVFDFGGGTLDLSQVRLEINEGQVKPTVLAVGGDPDLGGNLIDLLFLKVIIEKLYRDYENDAFIEEVYNAFNDFYINASNRSEIRFSKQVKPNVKQFIFRLRRTLELVKIKLSSEAKATILMEGKYKPIEISREQFIKYVLNHDDLSISEKVSKALSELSRKGHPVDEVLLIGGSSQIPHIKELILETFNEFHISERLISFSDDFIQAVAKGAAIQSALLAGEKIPPFINNNIKGVISRDIEIHQAGKSEVFVSEGTAYPFIERKVHTFSIAHSLSENIKLELQEICIDGLKKIPKKICELDFYLPFYYTGEEIVFTLNIDEAGLYQLDAYHSITGEFVEFEPIKNFSLNTNELNRAKDAFQSLTRKI